MEVSVLPEGEMDQDFIHDEDREWKEAEAVLRKEALSAQHQLAHKPYNKYCPICRAARAKRRPHRRKLVPRWRNLTFFGEMVTGDHLIVQATPAMRFMRAAQRNVGLTLPGGFVPRPNPLGWAVF